MPVHCEVELDIFSGVPNPAWSLTVAESENFVKQLSALAQTPARELAGNLGYRGFIVQYSQGADMQLVRVQNGITHISRGTTNLYVRDQDRRLERWLLNTGKPHLKEELFQIADRELRRVAAP
jgi:hypothetical protein